MASEAVQKNVSLLVLFWYLIGFETNVAFVAILISI